MIHTTDLMLGNWVQPMLAYGKKAIPMYVVGIFSDSVYLDFDGNEADVWEEYDKDLEGIPITEGVLEKTNLTRIAPHAFKDDALVYFYEENGNTIYAVSRNDMKVKVRYIHELQNAYFMLTNKRLEVKL